MKKYNMDKSKTYAKNKKYFVNSLLLLLEIRNFNDLSIDVARCEKSRYKLR